MHKVSRKSSIKLLSLVVALTFTGITSGADAKKDKTGEAGPDAQALNAGRSGSWTTAAQGKNELSVETLRKVVADKPNDAVAHNDLGWALRLNNDLKSAEVELRKAVELDPKMHQAHSNLSVVYFEQGKMQPALDQAQQSVNLDQSQPIYHVVLGNALSGVGDNKRAVEEYKLAISQKPNYENAYYNLGRVLEATGEKTEAGKVLAEALRLDPEDDRVMKILDRIVK